MAHAVTAIESYANDVVTIGPAHPLCGPCTLNVGTIQGGSSINIVPEQCSAEIEIRVPPGADLHALRLLLIEQVSRLQHDAPYMEGPPLSDENNAELAERLLSIVRKLQGDCRRRGEPYATNAAFYGSLGIPAVVFGPGSIAQAHTADEWVPLDEVRQAAEIIYQFIKTWRTT